MTCDSSLFFMSAPASCTTEAVLASCAYLLLYERAPQCSRQYLPLLRSDAYICDNVLAQYSCRCGSHLRAVIVHQGGAGQGHYTAFVRTQEQSLWMDCDDSSAPAICTTETVLASCAYLRLYEREYYYLPLLQIGTYICNTVLVRCCCFC